MATVKKNVAANATGKVAPTKKKTTTAKTTAAKKSVKAKKTDAKKTVKEEKPKMGLKQKLILGATAVGALAAGIFVGSRSGEKTGIAIGQEMARQEQAEKNNAPAPDQQ